MKLHKSLLLFGATALALAGCADDGATTEEQDAQDTEGTEQVEEVATESSETEEIPEEVTDGEEDLYEYNEVVADNENFTATLVSIEYIFDEMWEEEKIEVTFDIENKRDDAIEAQARSVSINDRMVDESLLSMSQEVGPGKSAEAVLDIQDYSGGELPELEGNFDMTLHFFSWDNMDYQEDVPVSAPLN